MSPLDWCRDASRVLDVGAPIACEIGGFVTGGAAASGASCLPPSSQERRVEGRYDMRCALSRIETRAMPGRVDTPCQL